MYYDDVFEISEGKLDVGEFNENCIYYRRWENDQSTFRSSITLPRCRVEDGVINIRKCVKVGHQQLLTTRTNINMVRAAEWTQLHMTSTIECHRRLAIVTYNLWRNGHGRLSEHTALGSRHWLRKFVILRQPFKHLSGDLQDETHLCTNSTSRETI